MSLQQVESLEPRLKFAAAAVPINIDGVSLSLRVRTASAVFTGSKGIDVSLKNGTSVGKVDGNAFTGGYNYDAMNKYVSPQYGYLRLSLPYNYAPYNNPGVQLYFDSASGGRFTMSLASQSGENTATGTFTLKVLPGSIRVNGAVINDLNGNNQIDTAERGVAGATVWADLNENGRYDRREPRTISNAKGRYTLEGVPTGLGRSIRCVTPKGWSFTLPTDGVAKTDVLVGSRATEQAVIFGASNGTILSGRAYRDFDRNGERNENDIDLAGVIVWADLDGDKRVDADEPQTVTNAFGQFTLVGQLPANTAIRLRTDFTVVLPAKRIFAFATANPRAADLQFTTR